MREWLGGLKACGVFASEFLSLLLLLSRFLLSLLVLLSSACPLLVLLPSLFVLVSLWVFVFSFSLTDYTQKERARRVGASSLRVLWACSVKFAFLFR